MARSPFLFLRTFVGRWSYLCCRYNSTQSLKSFYLAVHPDLFSSHPKEKYVNEESLKTFHAYLNAVEKKHPPYNVTLRFYEKQDEEKGIPREVKVCLTSHTKDGLIREVLQAFDIPVKDSVQPSTDVTRGWGDSLHMFESGMHDYANSMGNLQFGKFRVQKEETIQSWLLEHTMKIAENRKQANVIELDNLQILERLKNKFGVKQLSSNSTVYALSLVNVAMKRLEKLLNHEFQEFTGLHGRSLVFHNFSGIDQHGRFVVDINDVPENWRQALKRVDYELNLRRGVYDIERILSTKCYGIKFVRPRTIPSVPIMFYNHVLLTMLDNMQANEDSKCSANYTRVFAVPDWYDDFVSVSKEGHVKVPVRTSKKILYSFLQSNMEYIGSKRQEYLRDLAEEKSLLAQSKNHLLVNSIEKDYMVTISQLRRTCTQLASIAENAILKDVSVLISNYYSVSNDGLVRIPWNFKNVTP